jgi:hypothetical protein
VDARNEQTILAEVAKLIDESILVARTPEPAS